MYAGYTKPIFLMPDAGKERQFMNRILTGASLLDHATLPRQHRTPTGGGCRYFFPSISMGTLNVSRKVMAAIAEMTAVALVKMAT